MTHPRRPVSAPWWQPSSRLYPNGHRAGINKDFVVNGWEYETLFLPQSTIPQSDFGDPNLLKDWCGGGGTSILRLFLEVTTHIFVLILRPLCCYLWVVMEHGFLSLPTSQFSFWKFTSYLCPSGSPRNTAVTTTVWGRALGSLFFVPKKVSDKMLWLCVFHILPFNWYSRTQLSNLNYLLWLPTNSQPGRGKYRGLYSPIPSLPL